MELACCSRACVAVGRGHQERRRRCSTVCAAVAPPAPKSVVIVGTGRVGASAAAALAASGMKLTLCGRDRARFERVRDADPALRDASFARVELDDAQSLVQALRGADLVVHTAGPFQGRATCDVLQAALAAGVPAYLDVCDDAAYARRAKTFNEAARVAGLRAVVCGGIFPGVSNVLAAQMVCSGRAEGKGEPTRVAYNYYTAGSGGAGATILATSLLLCGEDAEVWKDGQLLLLPPVSGRRVVDFGGAGRRETFLYNLPETGSTHTSLGVPSVTARFGTSPGVWNGALAACARLLPRATLRDPAAALRLAAALEPLVRAVDGLVGEQTAMRVDVEFQGGATLCARFVHKRLSLSVGFCVAAFARDLLESPAPDSPAGVFFPEEQGALADAGLLLQRAAQGASEFSLAKAPWQLETRAKQLGFGLYWE